MSIRTPANLRLPGSGLGTALAAAAVVAVLASVLAPGAPMRHAFGRSDAGGADVIALLLAVGGELRSAPVDVAAGAIAGDAEPRAPRVPSVVEDRDAPCDRIAIAHLDLPPPRA